MSGGDAAGLARSDWAARLDALVDEARAADAVGALRGELERALRATGAGAAPRATANAGETPGRFGLLGDSPRMHAVFDLIERVAKSDVSVLVRGETGTGKELVARALHEHGARAGKPFLAENCAAVPPNLLESELFGHTKGSFTGAIADRHGHFVAADGGTLFLDEIGDMPLEMQAKLLRVLQEGEVRPVGSNRTRRVDVRVVAATHRDLLAMARERAFREDLYFRLAVITIELPPLRERAGDVELLARAFLARFAAENEKELALDDAALAALAAWDWPGNVRELENELRRAAALGAGRIGLEDLSPRLTAGT